MSKPYSSPPTNLRSLRDRLTHVAERQGVVFGRLQRQVAMIVVAQFAAMLTDDSGAPLLLVKGGSSLELRRGIPDSRTSKDFDTVARRDIESIHEQFADAGEAGWEGFTAIFTVPEEINVPGMPIKPRRFTAKLSYRGQPFASVPVEVSTIEAGNADQFDTLTSDALGLVGVLADIAVLDDPKVNDRAHDLVDLQLLEGLMADSDLIPTRNACIAVFDGRAQHLWPPSVAALPHWPLIYTAALEGLDHLELARTADAAAEAVQRFVARIDKATSG